MRIEVQIKLDDVRTKGNIENGSARFGFFDDDFIIIGHDYFSVDLCAADHKIPIGRLVLNNFFVLNFCGFHLFRQTVLSQHLIDDVAVFFIQIIIAEPPHGGFDCLIRAFDVRERVPPLLDTYSGFDHHALKNDFIFLVVARLDSDLCTGFKNTGVQYFKFFFGQVSVQYADFRRTDSIDPSLYFYRIDKVGFVQTGSVDFYVIGY